jgi:dolichol-phosphate mannosyltransferase
MNVTVVSPVYNEEECLHEFTRRMARVVDSLAEIDVTIKVLFVNDGSTDRTVNILKDITTSNSSFNSINLSSNFGHQAAVWCGLESVNPDHYVIVMDVDLQDPPEILPRVIELSKNHDVVLTKRRSRVDSKLKKLTASIYYKLLDNLSDGKVISNSGDFYMLSPNARKALLQHSESVKYIRGLIANLGFSSFTLAYDRDGRYAGSTHYTITKMFRLALAGVTGFSIKPLIYVTYTAISVSGITIIGSLYVFFLRFFKSNEFSPGIVSIILIQLLLGALILASLSVLSLYVARITLEVKKRPLYFIQSESKGDEGAQKL